MNREEGMELVQRSIDGDLNEEESSRLQLYLQNYPECAALLDRLTRLSEELTQLPHVAPRYSLVDAILPQLELIVPEPAPGAAVADETEETPYATRTRRVADRKSVYRRVAAVVAAGVVAGVLLIVQPFSLLPDSDQQKSASQLESVSESAPGAATADMMRKSVATEPSDGGDAQNGDNASLAQDAPGESSDASGSAAGGGSDPDTSVSFGAPLSSDGSGAAVTPTAKIEEQAPAPGSNVAPEANGDERKGFAPPAAASAGNVDKSGGTDGNAGDSVAGDSVASSEGQGPAATDAPSIADLPDMSFSVAMPSWESPDGALTALANRGGVRIVKTDGLATVFESDEREGTISDVTWGQDGQDLYYTWTDASGKSTDLWWNAEQNREQKR
ncbi:anti-sigma factor family protein [Cohnella sp. JJ-181]|uniref:anti-sigma factor family protein n=1 Tax=Cohnella rhizoplanae TaxID=2974897 RepID=UPI0022FFB3D1|nr:hypothetical protein [Cohnella sp. JJ-181]CAI6016519.1 hypothetical protein COHCIP112018_00129 [Cohnella sp. JJ-181]